METLYFILGAATILIVFGVVVVFRMYFKINKLEKSLIVTDKMCDDLDKKINHVYNTILNAIDKNQLDLNRRIDEETKSIWNDMSMTNNELGSRIDSEVRDIRESIKIYVEEIYRTIDSRLDKLENKLTNK